MKTQINPRTVIYFWLVIVGCMLPTTRSFAQDTRIWATYYGGTGDDFGYSTATDASGNVYLAGGTNSTTGIASAGAFQTTFGAGPGYQDGFLVKFDAAGNRLWATYYGGTGNDACTGVATDASGNVYISGSTTTNTPGVIASGGFQNTHGGGAFNAFLVKFDAAGNRLWATYYGGTLNAYGNDVATDAFGNVYLGGETSDSTVNIASGGFQNTYGGGPSDGYLVKFDAAGNRLWATYYGGTGSEYFSGKLATDALGNVYLGGSTTSTTGIASGGFQNTMVAGGGGFLAKFYVTGNRRWAIY